MKTSALILPLDEAADRRSFFDLNRLAVAQTFERFEQVMFGDDASMLTQFRRPIINRPFIKRAAPRIGEKCLRCSCRSEKICQLELSVPDGREAHAVRGRKVI